MPKSLSYIPTLFARIRSGKLPFGMAWWGALAGVLIGGGISLDIGLFYSSSTGLACIVLFVSGVMGVMFGHAMGHLLADDDVVFFGRAQGNNNHSVSGYEEHSSPTDHRGLKEEMQTIDIGNAGATQMRPSGCDGAHIFHLARAHSVITANNARRG